MSETIPGQAMLKCSQPSTIMPLHHICKAIHFLSAVLFVPSLYYTFLIRRIFIYLLLLLVGRVTLGTQCPVNDLSVGASVCPMHCGKTADRIRMPFGIIGRTGPGMRQVVWFGDQSMGRRLFGVNLERAIVINGDFTAYVRRVRWCHDAALFANYLPLLLLLVMRVM